MALHLGRVTYTNERLQCKVSRQWIGYGDFYFWDDTDDQFVVKADVWQEWRDYWKYVDFNLTLWDDYNNDRDYRNQLLQIQRQDYINTMVYGNRPRFDQNAY